MGEDNEQISKNDPQEPHAVDGGAVPSSACRDSREFRRGGGDNPYGATVNVEPEDGYSIDISKLESNDVEIFTSTSASEIAELITIRGPNGELDTTKFTVQMGSTSLTEGKNKLSIRLASDQSVLIGTLTVNATAVKPISLEATLDENTTIFTAYQGHEDQLNQYVTAIVTYNNGKTVELEDTQFSITAESFVVGERTFTVSCTIDGEKLTDTFTAEVVQQSFVDIIVDFNQTRNVPSYERTNVLTSTNKKYGTLTVYGVTPDGSQVKLTAGSQYVIVGSFWVGSEYEAEPVAELTIQDMQTGLIQETLEVKVDYVKPSLLFYNGNDYYFTVGETVQCDGTMVSVSYDGHGQRNAGVEEYKIEYQNGDSFTINDTYFTIVYKENGEEIRLQVDGIQVNEAIAYEPSFDDSYTVYDGTVQQRDMSGFDDETMNLVVTRDGVAVADSEWWFDDTDGDGIYTFRAVNAGVYELEVVLELGYRWNVSDEVKFSWTIDKAEIDPTLTLNKYEWDYKETGATWTVDGNPGNAEPMVYYWGISNSGTTTTLDQKITEQPTLAGVWHAKAYVPETANYKEGWTEQVNFTIERKAVAPPTPVDLPYTEGEQTVKLENYDIVRYTITSSDKGTVVNESGYKALLTMDADDACNYIWDDESWNGTDHTVTVTWYIVKAEVEKPYLTPNTKLVYEQGHTYRYTDAITVPQDSADKIDFGDEGLEGTDVRTAGYTVTVSLIDDQNYRWAEVTGDKESSSFTIRWYIQPQPVDYPEIVKEDDGWVYKEIDGAAQKVDAVISGNPNIIRITCDDNDVDINGLTVSTNQAGVYNIIPYLIDTTNYVWAEGSSTEPLTWTVNKAENNISGFTANNITYGKTPEVTAESDYGEVYFRYSAEKDGSFQELSGLLGYGTWYVKAYVDEDPNGNYESAKSEVKSFFVAKAKNTVEISGYAGKIYDGTALSETSFTIKADDRTGKLTFEYSKKGTDYETDLPTDAGTWYVKAVISESDNYSKGESKPVKVTISPFLLPYPKVTGDPLVYTENTPQTPAFGLFNEQGYPVTLPNNETIDQALRYTLPNDAVDADEYTLTFTPTNNYAWEGVDETQWRDPYGMTWEIERQPVKLPTFERQHSYDGNEFKPTIQTDGRYELENWNTGSQRDTYSVDARLVDDNYRWELNDDNLTRQWDTIDETNDLILHLTFEITNTLYDIEIKIYGWTYGNQPGTITPTIVSITVDGDPDADTSSITKQIENGDYTLVYRIQGTDETFEEIPTQPGVYEAYIRINSDDASNYTMRSSNWAEFEISNAQLVNPSFVLKDVIPYTGKNQNIMDLVESCTEASNGQDVTWVFSSEEDGEYSADISKSIPLRDAKSYTVYAKATALYHDDSDPIRIEFEIEPLAIKITIGGTDVNYRNYNGEPLTEEEIDSIDFVTNGKLVGDDAERDVLEVLGIEFSIESPSKNVGEYVVNGTHDCTNYDVTIQSGKFEIKAIPLGEIVPKDGETNYTGYNIDLSDLIGNLPSKTKVGNDDITWTYGESYNSEGTGYGDSFERRNQDTYEIYIRGVAQNHIVYAPEEPVEVTIKKAPLKIVVEKEDVQYGEEPEFEVKINGFLGTDSLDSLSVKVIPVTDYEIGDPVGSEYDISLSYENESGLANYDITTTLDKLTVVPRDITITISKNSCDYDSNKTDETDYTESIKWDFSDGTSTYNGEELTVTFGIVSDTYPLTVGNSPYTVTYEVTGECADNYNVTLSNPEFTIDARAVTVRAGSNNTFSYTGDVPSVNYSVDPEDARNILTLKYKILENGAYRDLGSDEEPVNVGDYQLVITGSSSDNYTASNTIVEFKITKANYLDLVEGSSITIGNYEDNYDGDSHLPTVTVTGAGNPYAYGLQWEFYIDDRITEGITNQTNGSSVTVDIVFTISEQYRGNINAPESRHGTVRIDPLTVDVKWGDTDLTYNGTVQTVSATFEDPSKDSPVDLDVVATIAGKTADLKNADRYILTASLNNENNPSGNFVLRTGGIDTEGSYQKSCTISPRPVTIVADSKTMTYGDMVPELTWSYAEGLMAFVVDGTGERIEANSEIGIKLSYTPDNPAPAYGQTYTIGIDYSGLSGKDNYTITPVGGNLTVEQRHITISIHEQTHVYDGNEPTVGSVLETGDTTGDYHIVLGSLPENSNASGPGITLSKETGAGAGKYDIYVTYNPNYVIETDGSGADKFVIEGAEITNISVSYGGFTYDDDTSHNQTEFITSATTVNDQKHTFLFGLEEDELSENFTFSQAGHYVVYYKVTAPNHKDSDIKSFEFDGETAENSINQYSELQDWTYGMTPPTIMNPGSEQGTVKIVIHIGSKDGDVLKGGFTQDTNAGTYWIEFRVDSQISSHDHETPNYKSASESYEIEILRKSVSVNWSPSEHVYDGSNKTSTMTIETYMAFGKDGEHAYSPEPTTEFSDDNKTVTMTIGVAGTYHVWVQLTSDNYCWSGLSDVTERWIRVSWTITEGDNGWAVIDLSGFDGWTYNGSFVEPGEDMVKAEHGSVYFLYAADDNGNPDDVYTVRPFVDAGTYWIKAVVDGTESYSDLESNPKQYTITKATVVAPSIVGNSTLTYTGNEISVTLTTHVESPVYTLGTSATQVGYYQVTVGLRYPNNYMWADDGTSETRYLDWSILPIYVPVPTYGNGPVDGDGIGHLEYNLNEQTYPFSYDSQHLNVTGNKATVKGDCTAVFTLKDTHNYAWKDSELKPEQSCELLWRIDPMKLKVPTLEHDESEYVPGGVTNSVKGFNATYMSINTGSTALSLTVSGNDVSLVTYRVSTELDDGQYWVIIGLKTDNFVWSDATDENDRTRTLHWKVNPIVETLDLSDTVLDYTGDVVTYSPSRFDSMTMLVNGNTGFSPGDYDATFSFMDSLNYVWSTERSEYNIPEGASVTINEDEVVVKWSITRGVYDLDRLGTPTTKFVYDREEHYPVFENVPSWLTIIPDRTVTNASEGTVKITLTFSASEDSGYVLSETSRTYDVKVTQRPVMIVIEDKETVYGQDAPELTYRIGSETGFVDDVNVTLSVDYTNGNDKGDYYITVSHDAGDNYTVTIIPGKLTVNPATVPEPTETSVLYTGSDVGHPFEGPFDVSGDTVGKELGAYTVTLTLNDGNHVWWDGTNGPKTLTWTIVSGDVLRPEYFVIDTSEETYTGSKIKKSVTSRTPSIVEGVDFEVSYENNVHAGTATVIITGIGNHTGEVREEFTILPQKVTVPEMADVEYDGTEKSAPYESNDIYTVSGDLRGTDVGSYHVILTLKNTNDYQWSDGTTGPKALMWRIVSEKTLVKDYFVVDVSPEVYDGQPHTKLVECINPDLEYGTDYTVQYFNNTEASTDDNPARIVITGIGDHDGVLEYSFMIEKMTPVLTFVNDNFDRDESDGRFTLLPYLSPIISYDQLVWSSTDESVAVVDERTGEVTLTGIGTARIVATLPDGDNWHGCSAGYDLEVGETQTEIVVVPGPGGSGGDGDVIYIPTVIREEVDGGISDVTWLIILACTVTVMLALIWLLWNRRVMN